MCPLSAAGYIIFVWYLLIRVRENIVFLQPRSGKKVSVLPRKLWKVVELYAYKRL